MVIPPSRGGEPAIGKRADEFMLAEFPQFLERLGDKIGERNYPLTPPLGPALAFFLRGKALPGMPDDDPLRREIDIDPPKSEHLAAPEPRPEGESAYCALER